MVAVIALAACSFTAGAVTGDGAIADGKINDASRLDGHHVIVDSGLPPNCYGQGVVTVCFGGSNALAIPTMPFNVNGSAMTMIDTSMNNGPNCKALQAQVGGNDVCVIAATTIGISGTLIAHGPNPLVLVATDGIMVNGSGAIQVEGTGMMAGPGADTTACSRAGSGSGNPGGGGAGGSFIGAGGDGGVAGMSGGSGGAASPGIEPTLVTVLRGGCSGGDGTNGQPQGGGGGAVDLISGSTIQINGSILAGGGGGSGATGNNGGGGAGAGGMIVLDAQGGTHFNGGAAADANGGGGGQGQAPNINGSNGEDSIGPAVATGGSAANAGGSGGNGSFGATAAGSGQPGPSGNTGGGGGGGGAGLIFAWGPLSNSGSAAEISPAAIQR
jgi:hypothetical protein